MILEGKSVTWNLEQHGEMLEQHPCSSLPREMMESPSLAVIKNCGDVTFEDMLSGRCGDGLGLNSGIIKVSTGY